MVRESNKAEWLTTDIACNECTGSLNLHWEVSRAGQPKGDACATAVGTVNSQVDSNIEHSLVLSSQAFPHSAPFGSFLLKKLLLIPTGKHILFKGMKEHILIKFAGESNLQERANGINDRIISTIEFNKMTFETE